MASEPSKQPKPKSTPATPAPAVTKSETPPSVPKPPPLFRHIDWISFALTFLLVFIGYLYTLAPDLTLQDSGELAVGSMYAGVPHPPGYPVWTIYTWFFTKIVPFSNIAWRVGVSSAFASALSCALIALMVSRGSSMLIESIADFKGLERRLENLICMVTGFVSGVLIGFNGFMWSQSVIAEVYGLTILTMTGVLVCLLRWLYAPHQYRYLYLSWFLCGITFNNHQSLLVIAISMEVLILCVQPRLGRSMMFWNTLIWLMGWVMYRQGDISLLAGDTAVRVIFHGVGLSSLIAWVWLSVKTKASGMEWARDAILSIPTLLLLIWKGKESKGPALGYLTLAILIYYALDVVLYFRKQPLPWWPHWRRAIATGIMFILGVAFYLYMPLASMTNPPMNWGYPRTVGGFVHAFTRGQYEKIHPTSGTGRNIAEQTVSYITTYSKQVWFILIKGPVEEFNIAYLMLGIIPLFFFRKLQPRERAWLIGLVAFYLILGPFLLQLFNPAPDRQSLSLNKPFFIASHVIISLLIGYGLALLLSALATAYDRYRVPTLILFGAFTAIALYNVAETYMRTPYSVLRLTAIIGLVLAVGAVAVVLLLRARATIMALLALCALMPLYAIFGHWSENEQRGHLFGYWFGHDMFTPPFKGKNGKLTYSRAEREELIKTPQGRTNIYPEMTRDAILFGGTDPGRFCPTYMIFCESFIAPKDRRNPEFDRRDVYIITQNALADGTYLQYIRAHYNRSTEPDQPFFSILMRSEKERELNFRTNLLARTIAVPLDNFFLGLGARIEKERRQRGVYPPVEIHTPSNDDSQRCFSEYMADAQARMAKGQLRPGEDVRVVDNRVQVSGQVAVMAINALLAKVIFDRNPTNEFFVEESFPLEWMYPHLTPFGIIMKINREKLPELTQDIVEKDHNFWSDYSERLIGNWITYDTPVSNITQFAERVYVNKNYKGFKGDPAFVRDEDGQKAFSKLRSSIAGVYAWRVANETAGRAMMLEQRPPNTLTPEDKHLLEVHQRMFREAEFAFKQAYAFCPYSPEALYRYVQLLAGARRFDDAILLAQTSQKLDPSNLGLVNLESELKRLKAQAGGTASAPTDPALPRLEAAYRANPRELSNVLPLAQAYASMGRTADVLRIADEVVASPQSDKSAISFAAQVYQQLGDYPKLESALARWAKLEQTPEAWLDYAASQAVQNRQKEAIATLQQALDLNRARLKADAKAGNIAPTIQGDPRFASLKVNPDFQQLLATNK
jgi:tetratricopeptide (TPR) repeat protein